MDDTSGTPTREHPARRRVVPTPAELASWRSFLRAHAGVTRQLETELEGEQQLSLAAYDVLVQLSEAPGHRLRMTELADAVLLSRSGVTRLVDRLERVGLVARAKVADDGRGVTARLTDTGYDRLRTAAVTHLRGVRAHFVERLDADDLAALERIMGRLVPERS
ncbi:MULTISPECIES: MarR family winged helix-turn-helix transcriptional regulator [Pseudonocardia]|uniref:MarR family transcriptional regulator n=1 Tax=Pseudonocardia alni subsp. carboxydivorans TaxID=415010 RepID=A0ABU9AEE0_PSEA5|nr:MarR family transcriptional regulator [Pseudonocardia sp. DR1-2]MCM3848432.1 MarR family transcriptional regulator [Pseudonocardia sp. DR1-2]WFG43070.1 MarR family transcriptional regulator [Pseudonocardia alni]